MIETTTIYERGWIMRIRRPKAAPVDKVILLVHGWTGDEHSMDLFSHGLPENSLQIFPRGPFQAQNGYGWAAEQAGTFPPMHIFEPTCRKLMTEIEKRLGEMNVDRHRLLLAGFSQGGAVVSTLAALYPERIEKAAILAGFLPDVEDERELSGFKGKLFFVAHGTKDDTIPIAYAKQSIQKLKRAGAVVDYCEADIGHKLAAGCMKRLADFLSR